MTDDLSFTVGNSSATIDTRDDAYPTSPMNRAIVHHALRSAGFASTEDLTIERLGLTVPFGVYYGNKAQVQAKRAASFAIPVKAWGKDRHNLSILGNGVRVYPESAIAWCDYLLDAKGQDAGDYDEPLAIIDVGGRTTDIAVMPDGGGLIDQESSGTDVLGVLDVISGIQQRVAKKFDVQLPLKTAEKALRERQIMLFGQPEDISAIVDDASRQVAEQMYQAVSRRIASGATLNRLIFIGGGASLMQEALRNYPHVQVPASPEFANARGVLKYMTFMEQQAEA